MKLREKILKLNKFLDILNQKYGITEKDVDLKLVREEHVIRSDGNTWDMTITTGVLTHDKELVLIPEKNPLRWVSIYDMETIVKSFNTGSCYMYMAEALDVLQ